MPIWLAINNSKTEEAKGIRCNPVHGFTHNPQTTHQVRNCLIHANDFNLPSSQMSLIAPSDRKEHPNIYTLWYSLYSSNAFVLAFSILFKTLHLLLILFVKCFIRKQFSCFFHISNFLPQIVILFSLSNNF